MEWLCFLRKKKPREEEQGQAQGGAKTIPASTSTSRSHDSGIAGRPVSRSWASTSTSSPQSLKSLYEEKAHHLRVFDFNELRAATNDFSRTLKIGEGGFGSVYKGFVKPLDGKGERTVVAVKRLNYRSLQGHKQWLAEIQYLGILEHPNLVKLLGYCSVDGERGKQRLLVYEFMPNLSLDEHLFRPTIPPLPWNVRLQVMLGAAECLTYLHEGLESEVIYRDFKASNILLDREFRPKLSDFGLAREGPTDGNTHVSTAAVGTQGYADPEYIQSGHLTTKSDVWSFGVVLYEILTGRRSLDRNRPKDEQKLLEWVKQYPANARNFRMMMDPRLRGQYTLSVARELAKLANACITKSSKERPRMSEVTDRLKAALKMETGRDEQGLAARRKKN